MGTFNQRKRPTPQYPAIFKKNKKKKPPKHQQKYQQTGSIGRQRGIQRGNVNSGRIVTGFEIRKRTAVTSTSKANGHNVNKYNNNRNIEHRVWQQDATAKTPAKTQQP